jgi:ethanolaminephosphotransferase
MWYYCPNLDEGLQEEGVPPWIFLFNFIAMLAYQTLDNADGKQARRTNSSSPLGLMFDHGCDALNSLPGSVNWAIACGLGFSKDPIQAWFVISCAMTLFYVTTWEEYYNNELILPIINGPNEGLIAGASFSLISFFWGVPYWHETTWFDRFIEPYSSRFFPALAIPNERVRNVDLIFYLCVVWLIQEEALKIYKVGRKYGGAACETLIPYLLLMAASTHIGLNHPEFLERNTRVCLNLVSALFAEMVIQLMLDHMCKERYNPYRFTLVPLCVLVILLHFNSSDESMVDDYVLMYCVAAWTFLFMKVRMIIHEMCSLLGIRCFDIVTPFPADKANVIT